MTRNEKIQNTLSEALTKARELGIPEKSHDHYCAAYLAARYVDLKERADFKITDCAYTRFWMKQNKEIVYQVLSDLNIEELANIVDNPKLFHAYIALGIIEEIKYQQGWDEPDHAKEDDDRQRYQDYNLEKLGVC